MFYLEDIKAMHGIAAHLSADVDYEPRGSLGWSRYSEGVESRDWDRQYYRYITVKVEGPDPELEYDFEETTISHLKELMNHFTILLDS